MAVRLLAWIDEREAWAGGDAEFVAGYTSSDAVEREPARRSFRSDAAARQWVEDEARLLDVEVEWIEGG